MKGQLHQERSLKQEAFQQVEKLQNQVVDMEETFSRNSSAAGAHSPQLTLTDFKELMFPHVNSLVNVL